MEELSVNTVTGGSNSSYDSYTEESIEESEEIDLLFVDPRKPLTCYDKLGIDCIDYWDRSVIWCIRFFRKGNEAGK